MQNQPSRSNGKGLWAVPETTASYAAALLLLQNLILLSSTTCLVLGPSSFADTTRAATPAKEQQGQLSRSVTSLILSSIPSASLWTMVLLSFCECIDGERAHPKEPREGFWWSPWHWDIGSCLSWHCSGPLTLSKQLRGRGRPLMGSQETPASTVQADNTPQPQGLPCSTYQWGQVFLCCKL